LALLPIDAQRAEASHVTSLWSVASAKSPRDEQTRDAGRSGLRPVAPGVRSVLQFAVVCTTGDPQDRAMLDGPEHLSQFPSIDSQD
jgi:hypothetical protein